MGQLRTLRRQPARWRLAMDPPEALLEQWIARLELAPPLRSAPARAPVAVPERVVDASTEPPPPVDYPKIRTALARVAVRGSVASFDDAMGGSIVLGRDDASIVHQGTVATRGPLGLTLDTLRKQGLDDAQARATEFVASWFGLPFDSVAAEARPEGSLRWGMWPLRTPDVARALASWKEKAPASFAACLGDAGIDVDSASTQLTGPSWIAADPTRETLLRGARAIDAIVRDPRRLALLARAGRHPDAMAAQVQVVVRGSVLPLLRMSVSGERRRTLAEVARSPRTLVVLLLALRGLDHTGVAELLPAAAVGDADALDEAAWLESVFNALRGAGRGAIAHSARRAISSPELES